MKSIMEEASSILKAIEKGWTKAGQPKEFSVKIFEEPQRNFFGMTVKPAKIALFFNEVATEQPKAKGAHKAAPASQEPKIKEKPARKEPRIQQPQQPQRPQVARHSKEETPLDFQEQGDTTPATPTFTPPTTPVWSDAMVEDAQTWLKDMLKLTRLEHIDFHNQVQHFHLRIQFPRPVIEDQTRQKQFFSGLATIILQMLKQKYRRPLKGYKIILTTD